MAQALRAVVRRGSLRAAEEITGHKYEPIGRWLRRAAAHAEALTEALVHDLQLTEVEVDEFWSFVQRKGGAAEATGAGGGKRWGCVSVDRPSRFAVAWASGPRTAALAARVVQATRARTADRTGVVWISDGWEPYAETIADTSCDRVSATDAPHFPHCFAINSRSP